MAGSDRALVKRSTTDGLMLPPPPRKRIKRPTQVLDEDVYSDAVSHIIARDFFPGLLETQAQNEYLSALKSKDQSWIQDAGRNLTQVMTPGPGDRRKARTSFTPRLTTAADDTPIAGRDDFASETPARSVVSEEPQRQPVDTDMSLGAFQAKYTSEDNESFNELLDKQNYRQTTKYAHFFHGNKIPTARQLEYRAEKQKQIAAGEAQSQELIIHNSTGEERQLLAPGRPSQDLDARPSTVDSFPNHQGPRNTFMFDPESVEDNLVTTASLSEAISKAPPKSITYTATRFSATHEAPKAPPSPTMSSIDAAIARRSAPPPSSAGYSGAETPRVNGYAFVDADPTLSEVGVAVTDEEAEAEQIKAFNKFLPKAELVEQNPFSIAQQSKRENLHHKLVEKSDVARRKTGHRIDELQRLGITPGRTPTPKFATAPRRDGQMTPAARQLAAKLATPRKGW